MTNATKRHEHIEQKNLMTLEVIRVVPACVRLLQPSTK